MGTQLHPEHALNMARVAGGEHRGGSHACGAGVGGKVGRVGEWGVREVGVANGYVWNCRQPGLWPFV